MYQIWSNLVQKAEDFSRVCTIFDLNYVQKAESETKCGRLFLCDTRGKLSLKKAGKILQKP
ncbi:hypothetical protein HMPREF1579_01325 [Gardnerella vaginalis JCP8066]|nr:hypothetical protein HMPREF1579_01325 [Gardnerella vaginalis JCP8066]